MKIIVAYDGSQDVKEGLKATEKFFKNESGELILLYVVRKKEDVSKEEEEKAIEKGKKLLEKAKNLIDLPKVSIKEVVISDYSIAEAILNFVEKEEADLLIMGARGIRPDIIRYTLGSTTAKVATFAPCSIYIAKKK
ncbi:MAG: hypothetical protein DRP29_01745 [Thermodesulfobacteriota bacterium]|nr:MAG: hypothetical protein DRP29_01745 [Thermodesulfobacteriota bacterium]RLG11693.1 MAG: hypothetical protein DRN73_04710 [Candidatus Pacearchaeota archaeon]